MRMCFIGFCAVAILTVASTKTGYAQEAKPVTTTAGHVCGQVPLYPVGQGLWAWWSYHYEDVCGSGTPYAIIEYDEYGPFPELCPCDAYARSASVTDDVKEPSEQAALVRLDKDNVPADWTVDLDLFAKPESSLPKPSIRLLQVQFFRSTGSRTRYLKMFYIAVAPRPTADDFVKVKYLIETVEPTNFTDAEIRDLPEIDIDDMEKVLDEDDTESDFLWTKRDDPTMVIRLVP